MLYYIKQNTIHRYPEPPRCEARHENEVFRDTVPHGVEKCDYCMHWWPEGDERSRKMLR